MTEIPAFGSLDAQDYAHIGFRCGLEIHQQLLTRRKLFCRCPAGIYCRDHDAEILRHMRPTLSELGEYDGTALMEFKTRKNIIYRLNFDLVCTYEMDDAPPFEINDQAVDITLKIGLLMHLKLIDELHIARKQYLDGSIPTGFQRTTILGVDGWVPYQDRRIGIRQLALEEDSCREVSDVGHVRTYVADRLGTPLIETVTEPDMKTPCEAAQVGQVLRRLVAATGNVRRGIGAARQDVNVSITGGTRIEIKGVPRLPMIPQLTHYEAFRQKSLLDIRDELGARGIRPDGWKARRADVTGLLQRTGFKAIAKSIQRGGHVAAVVLPGFAGLLSRPTQPLTPFLQEFSDRLRVIACLQNRPNLICSDLPADTLTPGLWTKLQKTLAASASDALMVVWGEPEDVRTAAKEIEIRALEAMQGVPSETRQAFADGTNGFERILPGPNRMYPDTDLPPIAIGRSRIERIAEDLCERSWDRQARYEKLGLHAELAHSLLRSEWADLFDLIMTKATGVRPSLVAYVLACKLKDAKRQGRPLDVLSSDFFVQLFALAGEHHWPKETIHDTVERALAEGRTLSREEMISLAPRTLSGDQLCQRAERLLSKTDFRLRKGTRPAEVRWGSFAMGMVMRDLRGRAEGDTIRQYVDRLSKSDTKEEQASR